MTIILASTIHYYNKDENGVRHSISIKDKNEILTNIINRLPKQESVVFIANDANNIQNDYIANIFFESLDKTGLLFKNKILLDNRNKNQAKSIIQNADLIFLKGGRVVCGKDFCTSIKLKKLLKKHKGIVIGESAGSMIMCKKIYNFPEMMFDTFEAGCEKGIGLVDNILFFPHFGGETKTYQSNAERDVVNNYILPYSCKKELIGVPNDSYILIDKNGKKSYGDIFSIKNGEVKKIKFENNFLKDLSWFNLWVYLPNNFF